MPIFEYICKECDHEFEALVLGSDKASCPKCQSKKLAPQLIRVRGFRQIGVECHPSRGRAMWLLRRSPRSRRMFSGLSLPSPVTFGLPC
jgi:putative FmdB family regulatory protein